MGSYVIDVTVKELTVPNSPLIAKAYDAGLIKVTDIQDGVVGDLSTFRVDASKAGEYIYSENYICSCLGVSMPTIVEFLGAESTELM